MNPIDGLVGFFNPVKGVQRAHARKMLAYADGYVGASRSRRSLKDFIVGNSDPDTILSRDHQTLVNRSRDLLRNSPVAVGAINTKLTSVVGKGLILQSHVDRDVLKLTEEQATAIESQLEKEYYLWGDTVECDAGRQLTQAGLQELAYRQKLEAGESFTFFTQINRYGSPYKTKLQIVEGDRISTPGNMRDGILEGGNYLFKGVERSPSGAPVAYYLASDHPGSANRKSLKWERINAYGPKTGFRNVIHLYDVSRPGLTRGIPWLAPVVELVKQITTLSESEITAAVIQSFFTMVITSQAADETVPLQTSGQTTNDEIKLGSGGVVSLAPGENAIFANPTRPNGNFESAFRVFCHQIAMGLNMPLETFLKSYQASFSASKAAFMEAWRGFYADRLAFAANWCQHVYERVIIEAVLLGRVKLPGFFDDYAIRAAYLGSEWTGDSMGQINPSDEVAAARERISLRLSTISQETVALTGGDFERNMRQIAKERALMKQLGVLPEETKPAQPKEDKKDDEID